MPAPKRKPTKKNIVVKNGKILDKKTLRKEKIKKSAKQIPGKAVDKYSQKKFDEFNNEIKSEDTAINDVHSYAWEKGKKVVDTGKNKIRQKVSDKQDKKIIQKAEVKAKNVENTKHGIGTVSKEKQKKGIKKKYGRAAIQSYYLQKEENLFPYIPFGVGHLFRRPRRQVNKVKDGTGVLFSAVGSVLVIYTILCSLALVLIIAFIMILVTSMQESVWNANNGAIESLENDWLKYEAGLRKSLDEWSFSDDVEDQISQLKADHPNADEATIPPPTEKIRHNLFQLMSYYAAKYDDFTYWSVKDENDEIMKAVYHNQELQESVDYKEFAGFGFVSKQVTFSYTPLEDILMARMNDEEKAKYNNYLYSAGGHQIYYSPFVGWINYVSHVPHYGYYYDGSSIVSADRMYLRNIPDNTEINAMADGVISDVIHDDATGTFTIQAERKGGGKYVIYSLKSVNVAKEQQVVKGEIVGISGTSLEIQTSATMFQNGLVPAYNWNNPEFLIE